MSVVDKYIRPYLKAHFAGLSAAAMLLATDMQSQHGIDRLTMNQWIGVVGAFLVAAGLVASVPNTPLAAPVDQTPAEPVAPVAQDSADALPVTFTPPAA